ncbi:MAG TPA: hypothetical protein VF137_11990 [Candidatus Dormibacteraeota bacterium]
MKDKAKGKVEELKGKALGQPGEEAKGKGRQKLGEAKDQVRDARRAVEKDLRGDGARQP